MLKTRKSPGRRDSSWYRSAKRVCRDPNRICAASHAVPPSLNSHLSATLSVGPRRRNGEWLLATQRSALNHRPGQPQSGSRGKLPGHQRRPRPASQSSGLASPDLAALLRAAWTKGTMLWNRRPRVRRGVSHVGKAEAIRSVPQVAGDSTEGPARRPLPLACHRALRGRSRGHRNGGQRADGLPARMHDRRACRDRRATAERNRRRAHLLTRRAKEGRLRLAAANAESRELSRHASAGRKSTAPRGAAGGGPYVSKHAAANDPNRPGTGRPNTSGSGAKADRTPTKFATDSRPATRAAIAIAPSATPRSSLQVLLADVSV